MAGEVGEIPSGRRIWHTVAQSEMLRGPVQGLETGFWEFGAAPGDSQGGNKEPPCATTKNWILPTTSRSVKSDFFPRGCSKEWGLAHRWLLT